MAQRERIAIIGLGTVGTAIGLGLTAAKLNNVEVVGHDRDADAAGRAKKRGAVDATQWNLPAAADGAGLVVLALPYDQVLPTIEALKPVLAPGVIVTDTAVVKRELLATVPAMLPEGAHYVSGNPILRWREAAPGIREATTAEATYCLLPPPGAPREAVETMIGLVGAIGATPLFVDPAEHDAFMAATIQLPELLSAALLGAISARPSWREMQQVTGDALLRFTEALAAPSIRANELRTNAADLRRWTDAVVQEMHSLTSLAQDDAAAFNQRLETISGLQFHLSRHETADRIDAVDAIPNVKEEMGRALFGQRLLNAARGKRDDARRK